MNLTLLKHIEVPEITKLNGIVKQIRTFKWGGFVLLDTPDLGLIQCVIKSVDLLSQFKPESTVEVSGKMEPAKIQKAKVLHEWEFQIHTISVIVTPEKEISFNLYEKELHLDVNNILDLRYLSLRSEYFKNIFRIQSTILNEFRNYLTENNFTSICSPKIVSGGAEGGANVFTIDYFGKPAYLAQSPQLYKQMMVPVFLKVFETGPVFRAEPHATSRHVNEYTSMDVEMMLSNNFLELIELEKSLLIHILDKVTLMEEYADLAIDQQKAANETCNNVNSSFIVSWHQAKDILGTNKQFDFTSEEEAQIAKYAKEKFNTDFVFITHYPKWARPFYSKLSSNKETTETFDLLYKGMEITSGGQRSNTYTEYIERMSELGMNPNDFRDYLENFKYGVPPHGGFAIGLERITAKICNMESTKLATLFPRDVERLTP